MKVTDSDDRGSGACLNLHLGVAECDCNVGLLDDSFWGSVGNRRTA